MSSTPLNHAELAVSRLTGLYQDKLKWRAFVALLASAFDDLETVLETISRLDDVDARKSDDSYLVGGVNLDVLGARIGQPRRITAATPLLYFGWDEDDEALGWGEDDEELSGGSWYEDGQPTTADALMDDPTYRVAIRLRRLKNMVKELSLETIIDGLLFIFPDLEDLGAYALVLYDLTGVVLIGLGRQPTPLELALLRKTNAFPKPAGVALAGYWWSYGSDTFSFDDDLDPGAAGWGEEGDPDAGGVFAEEF